MWSYAQTYQYSLVGYRREFPCPICRKKTVVPERGMEAFPDNRYLQELIENQAQDQWKICRKHNTPLSLFCNDCEKCICASCGLVTHRTHNLIELDDKAHAAHKEMQAGIKKANKHKEGWEDLVSKIDEGKETVNVMTDATLKKIEDSKREFRNTITRVTKIFEDATKKKINEVKATKANSIKNLNKSKQKIQNKKNGIERQIEEMERQLKMDNPSEVIQLSKETLTELEKILQDSRNINNDEIIAKVPGFDKPNFQHQLQLEDCGAACEEVLSIGRPVKTWKPTKWASLGFKAWEYSEIAVSEDGPVVVYGQMENDGIALKSFSKDGEEIWHLDLNICTYDSDDSDSDSGSDDVVASIKDITFVESGNSKYVMTTDSDDHAVLRNISDGTIVSQTEMLFSPEKICSYANANNGGFMLNGSSKSIHEFFLEGETVKVMNWEAIQYSFTNLYGFCVAKSGTGKMMFVLSSWQNSTIQAIDFTSGEVVWEVTGEYEGKEIRPHGMCGDESGNIYVADGSNCRVLQISCIGKIEKSLFNTEGLAVGIQWLKKHSKLLVSHKDCDADAITVYEM